MVGLRKCNTKKSDIRRATVSGTTRLKRNDRNTKTWMQGILTSSHVGTGLRSGIRRNDDDMLISN